MGREIGHQLMRAAGERLRDMENLRAALMWVATVYFLLLTKLMGRVSAYYLPLDMCDFYFEGHRDSSPVFDVVENKNLTFPPSILTKDDVPVTRAQMNTNCAFLADPSIVFGFTQPCSGNFSVTDHKLSALFSDTRSSPLFSAYRGHHALLPFERVELQDGTVLAPGDGIIRYLQTRRCLTFFTAPGAIDQTMRTGKQPDLLTEIVSKMLNKEHRKKLKKLDKSVVELRHNLRSVLHDLISFP